MSPATDTRVFTVALIGNPNTGKSTLFTGLVGVRQHVGNYPGVTVEKKTGRMQFAGRQFELIDLPGLYSLAPRSRDEMVAVDLLLGRREDTPPVDAVLCIVDASNLRRNLYLLSQVLELGLPTVVAVNMLDVAESHGIKLDVARLERQLGVAVVPVQANRRIGISQLRTALARAVKGGGQRGAGGGDWADENSMKTGTGTATNSGLDRATVQPVAEPVPVFIRPGGDCPNFCGHRGEAVVDENGTVPLQGTASLPRHTERACYTPLPPAFENEVLLLESELAADPDSHDSKPLPRCLVRRLLLDANGYLQRTLLVDPDGQWQRRLIEARGRLAEAGCPVPSVETCARYDWAKQVLEGVLTEPGRYRTTTTDRIDRVLTHRLWGTLVFAAIMLIIFQAVFVGARPAMDAIQTATAAAGDWIKSHMAEGALRSLIVEGVIGGVGAVFSFLPQILVLFAFLAMLEDCGYMARAAYLMDRVMVGVGLSGKSFIPLLSSFACAVPGIMATRVIENERDRLTTILVAPLLTCSARLPIYALLIAAVIPSQSYLGGLLNLQGLTLAGLYLLGVVAAVVFAMVFKRTLLRGHAPPFVMELPSYKWPSPRTVFFRMVERGWVFVRCAGTLILAVSILVWAALYYPHNPQASHQQQQRESYLGQGGRIIEPAVRPLGWDWRIGCAVLASLPAREIVVATLGVMYHFDDEKAGDGSKDPASWSEKVRRVTWDGTNRPVFTVPVALSIMVFFALCAQCAATLAVIRRETNSWRWPAFTFAYMTALAYVGALITYQIGSWIAA